MNADVAALLAAIDEDPSDDARYLVLADALTTAGDPHGELIMLQHALARKPDREVLRRASRVQGHMAGVSWSAASTASTGGVLTNCRTTTPPRETLPSLQ